MGVKVWAVVTGNWKENCYVVHDAEGDAVVIDPGGEAEAIIGYIQNNKLKAQSILNTHGHYDHVAAVKELQTRLEVPFYLHSKDLRLLKSANLYRKLFDVYEPIAVPEVDRFTDQVGSPIHLGGLSVEVIASPGHTKGSVCFLIEDNLFSGDTLFRGAIGRVDLPGGDRSDLDGSLRILGQLPPATKVYPGHGEPTAIQQELRTNVESTQAVE